MKKKLLQMLYKIFALFAKIYLKRTKPQIIGVTGSVGKTSARMIIFQVLKQFLPEKAIYTSPKNFNSELGLVFSIFGIESYTPSIKNLLKMLFVLGFKSMFGKKQYDIIVLEYGIDHPGDMNFLLNIAKPDIAFFTQLDYIHAENFDSKNAVGEEKIKLLKAAKIKFLNAQDEFQKQYFEKLDGEKYFYNEKNIDFSFKKEGDEILATFELEKVENADLHSLRVTTNMLGSENFIYIVLALRIVEEIKTSPLAPLLKGEGNNRKKISEIPVSKETGIRECFLRLTNQKGRFSIFPGVADSILVDSSYNAGSESMKKMIENVLDLQQKLFPDRKLLFVLGDMREVGDVSEQLHRDMYQFASQFGEIISVGAETNQYFGEHLGNFTYSREAGIFLKEYLQNSNEKYIILFKGSQNTIFLEEAIKQVLKHKADEKSLVRQETYWKKEEF